MNKQTSLPGKDASWTKRTDTPLTPMKGPSSKPSPRKNGSSNTRTSTSLTASTNWTDQSRLFCSGWELGTTDLMPTVQQVHTLASLRCVHATLTWPQNIYYITANHMMLWGGTCGQNWYHWGTSSMATWRSWGGQPLSWGRRASSVRVRREKKFSPSLSLSEISLQYNLKFSGKALSLCACLSVRHLPSVQPQIQWKSSLSLSACLSVRHLPSVQPQIQWKSSLSLSACLSVRHLPSIQPQIQWKILSLSLSSPWDNRTRWLGVKH